ncbi:MAG TPA: M23 family metallopeptidase [Stackebrandtia sp.]|jgi:hypothetical protein|uniref:M23 family metallopeptidase n=1 Tax=Stackebrandtia sp. TaxID=2023065 RepID=UPI002D335227|nr:M23 family metallopeptidase [Stackebrandtia sp.]HZE37918.1 M23 family metallopeptidase [Stackebrandtia sp.]
MPRTKRRWLIGLLSALALAATAIAPSIAHADVTAQAAPAFKMPFRCGETWTAATFSTHSPQLAVDFQGTNIKGTPVASAAAGKVTHAGTMSGTGYGNLVIVDHGGGWTTRYAHLDSMTVAVGDYVDLGTRIGYVGQTGQVTGPHLHFEERYNDVTQKVVIDGAAVPYYAHTPFTSKNYCGANIYSSQKLCGSGYGVVDSAALSNVAQVYLLYNSSTGSNCAVTIKHKNVGTASATSAFVEPQGGTRATDSGSFTYYAGPVKVTAKGTCVRWGGSYGSTTYTSPFEHCG